MIDAVMTIAFVVWVSFFMFIFVFYGDERTSGKHLLFSSFWPVTLPGTLILWYQKKVVRR